MSCANEKMKLTRKSILVLRVNFIFLLAWLIYLKSTQLMFYDVQSILKTPYNKDIKQKEAICYEHR